MPGSLTGRGGDLAVVHHREHGGERDEEFGQEYQLAQHRDSGTAADYILSHMKIS